jgi:hypothetical protein
MAFSGTTSQTVFNTRKVIDNAIRRCRVPAQQITSEHIDIANDQLYLLLGELANRGTPLWCIEKVLVPLYDGQGDVTLSAATVDILNSSLRSLQPVTGTNTTTGTSVTTDFGSDTFVTTVGIRWSAAAVPINLQRSTDGATWTTIQSETPSAVSGEWTWFDLDTSIAAPYFRVLATSGVLSASQVYLGNTPTEIPLSRMNRDDYTSLPNKFFQSSRPLQFWFDRQVRQPIMHMWPVPNSAATTSQLVVWRQRYIMDVGSMTQEVEVPQRWYEALVAGLAARMAMEIIEVDPGIIPMLDQKAAIALNIAQMEERDNSPMTISPNIAMYTR